MERQKFSPLSKAREGLCFAKFRKLLSCSATQIQPLCCFGDRLTLCSREHIFNNQAKPSRQACLSASERRLLRERSENGAKHEVPPQSGEARKEYKYAIPLGWICYHDMRHRADELTVLNYTPIGVGALRALGTSCYARLVSSRRGAICGIRPDKRASRCECS